MAYKLLLLDQLSERERERKTENHFLLLSNAVMKDKNHETSLTLIVLRKQRERKRNKREKEGV